MAESLHILTPRIDRAKVCEVVGTAPKDLAWKSVEWRDGQAKMLLEAIDRTGDREKFDRLLAEYRELFAEVASGEDLEEINKRIGETTWILKITATPSFEATAEDSQTLARIALELDGTCIAANAVVDPATGEAILAWGDDE